MHLIQQSLALAVSLALLGGCSPADVPKAPAETVTAPSAQ